MDEKDKNEFKFKYSWEWFKYHAQQRLIAFRYFLLVIGIIGVGYIQSDNNFLLKLLLCIGGIVISLAFFRLEIRNEGLVNFARDEIDEFETKIGVKIREKDKKVKEKKYCIPISHKFWLRFIYILVLIGFLALFLDLLFQNISFSFK